MSNKQEMVTIPKKYLERLWVSHQTRGLEDDEIIVIKQDDKRFYRALKNAGLVTPTKKNPVYKKIREEKQLAKAFFDREFDREFLIQYSTKLGEGYGSTIYGLKKVKIVGRSPKRTKLRVKFVHENSPVFEIEASSLRLAEESCHVWNDDLKMFINKLEVKRVNDYFKCLDPSYFDELELGL